MLKWFDNPYFIQKQPNLEALDNGNDDNDINNIIDEAKVNLGKSIYNIRGNGGLSISSVVEF